MIYKFNSQNKVALFNNLNQGDEEWSKMCCSFFAPSVNLKYNCNIELTERDIKEIASTQNALWKFSYTKWGYWSDWVEAVYQFVKNNARQRWWNIPNLAIFKPEDKNELNKWLSRGYSTMIGVKISKEFYNDARDGLINKYEDYKNYKWNIWHFLNIWTRTWRFEREKEDYEDFILDNYVWNERWDKWYYKSNNEEVLEDLVMPSKYIFF